MKYRLIRLLVLVCFIFTGAIVTAGEDQPEGGKKEILVYIDRQVLVAMEGDEEIYSFDVVTGKEGKETVAGTYAIFRKHEKYTSKTYGSEMPYTMFFTEDGKAIHGTRMATLRSYVHAMFSESVGSEGCVGLTDDHAKLLFDWAEVGTSVVVIREPVATEGQTDSQQESPAKAETETEAP